MFVVGKVLKPQGINGSVKVEIITSFPEHFMDLKKVYVQKENKKQAYSIEQVRLSNRFVFIKFAEVNSIEEAETLRNQYLYITGDELMPLGEDEYYIHDLLGLKVFDEAGTYLGVIKDVLTYTANDVYVLHTEDGREVLLPAIKSVVKKVDVQAGVMTIHLMEGLFDL
ncbi:ribosome maturation factor RimM [Calditrichota bacterium LG25]